MIRYRVIWMGENEEKAHRFWPTLEQARAFFSGLKQAGVEKVRIFQVEDDKAPVLVPFAPARSESSEDTEDQG